MCVELYNNLPAVFKLLKLANGIIKALLLKIGEIMIVTLNNIITP